MLRLALLILLAAALGTAIRPVWTLDPDAAAYVTLARSLAAGDGYVLDDTPHGKYPPGLPLMLAGVIRVFGSDAYAAMHGALVACLLASIVLTWAVLRSLGYRETVSLAVAGAVGVSQTLFELSVVYIRSEVLFLALGIAAVGLLCRATRADGGLGATLLGALVLAAAISVRLAGVALIAIPALAVLRSDRGVAPRARALLLALVGVGAVGAWVWHGQQLRTADPDAPDYATELLAAEPRDLTKNVRLDMPTLDAAGLVDRVSGNLEVMTRSIGVLLINVDRVGSKLAVGAALTALVAIGLVCLWRRGDAHRALAAYVLATLALYALWPFNQQERFYVPLLPWLVLAAGEGLAALLRLVQTVAILRFGPPLLLLASGALILVLALQTSDHPTILDRWSTSYASMLGALVVGWIGFAIGLRRGGRTLAPSRAWLAYPLLVALPFAILRAQVWPHRVAEFEARREAAPREPPLDRIDVHPLLEDVAVWLRENTVEDAVVMTDVPKMLAILSGRRCVPFTYRLDPPDVVADGADFVFYTRQWHDVALVTDASASRFDVAFALPSDVSGEPGPTVYRVR